MAIAEVRQSGLDQRTVSCLCSFLIRHDFLHRFHLCGSNEPVDSENVHWPLIVEPKEDEKRVAEPGWSS